MSTPEVSPPPSAEDKAQAQRDTLPRVTRLQRAEWAPRPGSGGLPPQGHAARTWLPQAPRRSPTRQMPSAHAASARRRNPIVSKEEVSPTRLGHGILFSGL